MQFIWNRILQPTEVDSLSRNIPGDCLTRKIVLSLALNQREKLFFGTTLGAATKAAHLHLPLETPPRVLSLFSRTFRRESSAVQSPGA